MPVPAPANDHRTAMLFLRELLIEGTLRDHETTKSELRRTKKYLTELEMERAEDKVKVADLTKIKEELLALKKMAADMQIQLNDNDEEIKELKRKIKMGLSREAGLKENVRSLEREHSTQTLKKSRYRSISSPRRVCWIYI